MGAGEHGPRIGLDLPADGPDGLPRNADSGTSIPLSLGSLRTEAGLGSTDHCVMPLARHRRGALWWLNRASGELDGGPRGDGGHSVGARRRRPIRIMTTRPLGQRAAAPTDIMNQRENRSAI